MNKTSFSYMGNVTLTIKVGDKLVELNNHNAGTTLLMKSFAKFLSGNYSGISDIPELLDIRDSNGASILSSLIPLSGKYYEFSSSHNNWISRFTALINSSSIIRQIESSQTYTLHLCSGYDSISLTNNNLAELEVSAEDLQTISPGTQAMVEWTMQVVNANEE